MFTSPFGPSRCLALFLTCFAVLSMPRMTSAQEVDPTGDAVDAADASAADVDPPAPQGPANGNVNRNKPATGPGAVGPTAAPGYVFPSTNDMTRYWVYNTLGPKAYAAAAFAASWSTWVTNTPKEWNGFRGWSQRFGVNLLDNGINTSSLVLLSGALHQDPRYLRCDCTGMKARISHAFKMTYSSRNDSGDLIFAPVKLATPFAGPFITRNYIYPDRFNNGDAAIAGAYNIGGTFAWNLIRELVIRPRY